MNKRLATVIATLLPFTALAAEWQTDYGQALDVAKKRDVPVFVYFSNSEPGDSFDKIEAAEDFVLLKAVKNTQAGDKLFKLFAMDSAEGCSVIDRSHDWQYVRYESKLSSSQIGKVLEKTRGVKGEPSDSFLQTVSYTEITPAESVSQPSVTPALSGWSTQSYCPSCQRR